MKRSADGVCDSVQSTRTGYENDQVPAAIGGSSMRSSYASTDNSAISIELSIKMARSWTFWYRHDGTKRLQPASSVSFSRNNANSILGPWLVRAGVKAALDTNQVELDTRENALMVLKSFLAPDISVWTQDNPLLDSFGGAFKVVENSSPTSLIG